MYNQIWEGVIWNEYCRATAILTLSNWMPRSHTQIIPKTSVLFPSSINMVDEVHAFKVSLKLFCILPGALR